MQKRIVLIGGGFVGTLAARLLAEARLSEVEVILISQTDHFLFSPLLIECLAQDITIETCTRALKPWSDDRGIRFIEGTICNVDRTKQVLTYEDRHTHQSETLRYDDLVFAQGGSSNFFRSIGAEEHAYTLKHTEDVEHIQAKLRLLIDEASRASSVETKRDLLCFGVAGGGPAGIESVCSLRRYSQKYSREQHPELLSLLSFFVIESSPDILPGFPDKMRTAAKTELTRQGISLHTGEAVTEVRAQEVVTPARTLRSSLLLWTAGIAPNVIPTNPAFDSTSPTGLPLLKNSVQLDEHHFVGGDVAALEWNEKRVPKNGQIAMQLGRQIAELLISRYQNKKATLYPPEIKGFFLGMGEVGFLSVCSWVLRSRFITLFRLYFYRFRMWQIL